MRLFLAVPLPPAAADALEDASGRLRTRARKGSFSRRENYHLTLAFLGETPPSALPVLRRVMGQAGAGREPFPLTLGGAGRFAGRDGDTWWVGLALSPPLADLAAGLDAALRGAGFAPPGREFCPHLTLARRVCAPGFAPAQLTVEPVSFRVERLCLMESLRIRQILTYRELFSVSLARPV